MADRQMMRVPRPAGSRFSEVPRAEIQRSQFDLSHGVKSTFDAGWLVPIYVDEALPGDTFNVNMQAFVRLATPIKPLMDNLYIDTFFFAVPYRLVWSNWHKFNGAQDTPGDSTDYLVPIVAAGVGNVTTGSLPDYMGVPINLSPGVTPISALPFRAYRLIWNQWFRDENLQAPLNVQLGDGPDGTAGLFSLARRGKRHDYFTSALPWPQKGATVSLPLGDKAPIATLTAADVGLAAKLGATTDSRMFKTDQGVNELLVTSGANVPGLGYTTGWLYADLAAATAANINQIRQAFQVQRLLERDARGGTRYTEIIKSHFGVSSPDQRLQRSEYLGGGSSPMFITPVAQTAASGGVTPQGNLSGIGTASFGNHGFTKSFTEHCILIGLMSVRADLSYQQGLNRMWFRRTRYDFFWPALANLGEQGILNKELFVTNDPGIDDLVFGYQERYAEYRYKPSMVTGLFRSDAAGTLDMWHLAQDFASTPLLNASFIQEDPPVDRVIAVPSEPHFLMDAYFRVKAARPMPVYGVPGLMDHF